jgi:hypothetical protein
MTQGHARCDDPGRREKFDGMAMHTEWGLSNSAARAILGKKLRQGEVRQKLGSQIRQTTGLWEGPERGKHQ